jgi:multiple sugar transport system substrate-binding protein
MQNFPLYMTLLILASINTDVRRFAVRCTANILLRAIAWSDRNAPVAATPDCFHRRTCLRPETPRKQGVLFLCLFVWFSSVEVLAEVRGFSSAGITIGAQNADAIGGPAIAHAATWGEKTGIKARVVRSDFGQLFANYMDSLTSTEPVYDVLLFPSSWAADFHPYLAEMPEGLRENDAFDDIHPSYRERLMTWDGKWIAATIDGDLFSGYYRKDLFNDPDNQAEFRARYGYELFPPDTWRQYRDIAEFFNRRSLPDGSLIYGTAEAFARNGQQFWTLFSRASAYTNHPEFLGAQFFDPDTMRAQINNPGWLRAVQEYKEISSFGPPDVLSFSIVEARNAFLSGRTAMALDWGDIATIAPDTARSKVAGKVGYFVLPGTRQIWNSRLWEWEDVDTIYKAPFLAFGGWIAGVPKNSRNKEAAWDYIMWLSSTENSLHDVTTSGTGINPYRFTHFTSIDAWTQALSMSAASEYLEVVRGSLDSPHVAMDLRIRGFYRYTEALEDELTRILQGESEVVEGMTRAASAWEAITDDLGREQQLADYRADMGLAKERGGPRAGAQADKQHFLIGFSQATTTEPWRLLFNRELRAEAARHPEIELVVRDAMDSVPRQVADMEEFISRGVDAILVSPKVTDELTPPVSRAFSMGIPVFVLDRDVANDRYTQYIGGDNREIGRAAGRRAVELLGGVAKAKGNVVEIWGGMGSSPAKDRHEGFAEIIAKEPGIRTVSQPRDGDWKQDLGYEIMIEAMDAHEHIDLVYAHNDPMAYGAYLAAREVNRENNISFLGIDGIPAEGVKWVKEGILDATFLYKTPGDEGIRQALRFLKGEPVPKRLTLPTLMIDRTNAAEVLKNYAGE